MYLLFVNYLYDCMVSILLIYFVFSVYELKHVCDKE